MVNNFQRVGSKSNSDLGNNFEAATQEYFRQKRIPLQRDYQVLVGLSSKKLRSFDLGSGDPRVLVECKCHTWTAGGNVPKLKPRWDVHLQGVGNQAVCCGGDLRPWIAVRSGSAS